MKITNVEKLCCPACRKHYDIRAISISDQEIETAFLTCPSCYISVLILRGFPLFDEQFLIDPKDLNQLSLKLFGSREEYFSFLERKRAKPVYDLYAAFQPFNESTQSIFPLIPVLQEVLKPADLILDLWCRTGWSGELLASLFPEQQVIAVWEGSAGLLGYKGFDFWLSSGKRRKNLEIIFHSPNHPLPFADQTFSVVHGLDTLHRYRHVPLIPECLRVVKQDGIIVFPHNHLTNSEPEPYFDRGEDQMHGKEYEEYFRQLLQGSKRRAFVLSEKTLFEAGANYHLTDEADTKHYNACILLADQQYEGRNFVRSEKESVTFQDAYVIVNPLWNIDLTKGEAIPAPEVMDSGGDTLFFRHPIYHERLKQHSPVLLNELDCLILYWAMRIKTISEIALILRKDLEELFQRLKNLEMKELVQMQNLSFAMAKLQNFYCGQEIPHCGEEATLTALWRKTISLHGERPFLLWPPDDSVFTYRDTDTIVRMAASFLNSQGVQPGDRILMDAVSHPEFVFLFWAAVLIGAVVVPINPEIKDDVLSAVLLKTRPKLVFIDPAGQSKFSSIKKQSVLVFAVNEDSPAYPGSFSEQIADYNPLGEWPLFSDDQEAVVLFTSGSTGAPKGVVLSHGALFRTSRIIDRAYRWKSDDRFLGGGSFHTMSGLRNPCIAVLHSGASVVIPGKENSQNPLTVMNLCTKYRVSILNVTPAFLAYWSVAAQKAKYFQSDNLRLVLSTGSALQPVHRETFEKHFQVPVFDYYGLTETTGACILENADLKDIQDKGIGKPWECVVKIINEAGESQHLGSIGELAIYSENLMLGYLGDEERTRRRVRDGWFLTGDSAWVNAAGCVVLAGRKDRMMIDKNGENVYPEEIEKAICAVNGVTEAYVTQVRDQIEMDQIAALVHFNEPDTNIEDRVHRLRTALSSKLPLQHMPWLILAVPEIPKGPGGKVSVDAVRQLIHAASPHMRDGK